MRLPHKNCVIPFGDLGLATNSRIVFCHEGSKAQRTKTLFYFRDVNFPLREIEGAATSLFLIFTFLLFISLATKAQRQKEPPSFFISEMKTFPFGGLSGLPNHLTKLHIPWQFRFENIHVFFDSRIALIFHFISNGF